MAYDYNSVFLLFQEMFFSENKIATAEHFASAGLENEEFGELFLAMALCEKGDVRKAAKKTIQKRGGVGLNAVLKKLTRRNYSADTGNKNFEKDIVDIVDVDGFSSVRFSKYLFISNSSLYSARDHFIQGATDEELRFYFLENSHYNGEREKVRLFLGTRYKVSGRVASILWDCISTLRDKVSLIQLSTDDAIEFGPIPPCPKLYELSINADFKELPTGIYEQPALHKLGLSSPTLMSLPPGIERLQNLTRLSIDAPIDTWPDGVFRLANLESAYIENTKLTEIPAAIAGWNNLKSLNIPNNPDLKVISDELFSLPELNDAYKKEIRATYLATSPYAKLVLEMDFYLRWFQDIPLIAAATKAIRAEEPQNPSELILAVSKCYYDDEHGRKLVNLFKTVDEHAPQELQKINRAIKSPAYYDEKTSDAVFSKARTQLVSFDTFDQDLFLRYVGEMITFVDEKYPHDKW